MKKEVLKFLTLLFFVTPLSAQEFNDLPQYHWAQAQVNELVKLGIMNGYPDGTFRGNRPVSRYEAAVMLAKLPAGGQNEKVLEELKTEIAVLKYKAQKYSPKFNYRAQLDFLSGNSTIKTNYRAAASYSKPLAGGMAALRLDTLDAGFNSSQARNFLEMINLIYTRPGEKTKLTFAAGAGDILHFDQDIPSNNYQVFLNEYPSASLKTSANKIDLEATVRARNITDSGIVGFTELDASFSHTFLKAPVFNKIIFSLRPRYFIRHDANNFRLETSAYLAPTPNFNQRLTVGLGKERDMPQGLAVMYTMNLKGGSTEFNLDFTKLGSEYRNASLNYYILNIFDRAILDGTYDAGIKLTQKVAGKSSIYLIENINTNYSTTQFGVQCQPFELFYRWYNVPTGNDGYGAAPINSNLAGFSFNL